MNKSKTVYKSFLPLTLFAIAFAFVEAAVVFYLRKLFYPEGFAFPLKIIPLDFLAIEWVREIATIVIILSIAIIAGRNFMQRFASFLYVFAIWDIFYYIWLKLILGWPASLLTQDLLFLIPVPWVGPVLAPILLSLTMILLAALIIHTKKQIIRREWLLLISGSILVLLTFIWNYNWPLFIFAEALLLYAIWLFYKRTKKS
jgi:hypothetical protein